MNQPNNTTPLLSSIAPNPNPPTNQSTVKTVSSQIQRNKLQNVPAFLNKLYNMVDDHSTDELIRWSDNGLSFLVVRHEEFAKKVLPRFFKHSNFSSFVRQLNMYGFHKVPHLQNGVLGEPETTERWEFKNPHFQQNQPDLLLLVTRKKGRDPEERETGTVDMHQILDEIAAIKKHQTSISKELKLVQTDNQILWRENLASRDRHHRHQETIDKILRFLASVFSNDKKKKHVIPRRQYLLEGEQGKKRDHIKIEDAEEEDSPPLKQPRHHQDTFDISDYVQAANSLAKDMSLVPLPSPIISSLSSPSTSSTSSSTTPATADLQAAIAFNDQTKKEVNLSEAPMALTPSTTNDLSSLMNLPQFQGLLSLAQTSPALFNQLVNTSYFDLSPPTLDQPESVTTTDAESNPLDYINMNDFLNTYNIQPSSSSKSNSHSS